MTTRESVHRLVDDLPRHELSRAERVLEALLATVGEGLPQTLRDASAGEGLPQTLRDASVDDEPETPQERAAVEEALLDVERGRTISQADIKRRWDLDG